MHELRSFRLSDGYLDSAGAAYVDGGMRPAMVRDELVARRHPLVRGNPLYFTVVVLARVVERLGPLRGDQITPEVIENLSATDLERLRDLYRDVNQIAVDEDADGDRPDHPDTAAAIICPYCGGRFSAGEPRAGSGHDGSPE